MGDSNLDHHHNRTLIPAHSPCFLIHTNGVASGQNHDPFTDSKLEISDIEMISIQSATYTSLRDIIPTSPPATAMSPTNNSSWTEIPIRNPLVKQAALAYLQPKSTPPETGDKGVLGRLRERCGCLWWLRDAIWGTFKDAFWGLSEEAEAEEEADDEEEEEEEDDDDDDGEKVDSEI